MQSCVRTMTLADARATCALARALAPRLTPGDTVLLEGPIGAGKTHFARCLIQSLLSTPEDIPSPTFTLVQTYDTPSGEIWHGDLYRLSDPSEVIELGLADAFETAICLIEWPDRLGPLAPPSALRLSLHPDGTGDVRTAHLTGNTPRWRDLLNGLTFEHA